MEASVADQPQTAPADPAPSHDGASEATRSAEELFQWSGYVHVGTGAEECEHRVDGECKDPEHFHAWVCLPNPYQIRDINDKARAAKARKRRALRDPTADSYVTLEDELDDMREGDAFAMLKKVIAQRQVETKLLDMVADLRDDDRFEHHEQDAEEFRRLQAIPEEDRDAEEFERLQADMLAYADKLQAVVDERAAAEERYLEGKPVDEVIALERRARIDNIANETFLHTYYTWVIYTCAREPTTEGFPSQRKFKTPEDQKYAPPEVIVALRQKINSLEQRTARRSEAAGN